MINVKGCELGATTHLANLFFLVIDLFFQKILFQSYFIDCDDFGFLGWRKNLPQWLLLEQMMQ